MNMPNSEVPVESKNKQPTGSSKRKRKHSIKRNIVYDDNSNCNETIKSAKVEKTYGKRVKGEKSKQGSEVDEVPKMERQPGDVPHSEQEKNEDTNEEISVKFECSEGKCKNLRSTTPAPGQCSSMKQQCQNCKFCSEHLVNKDSTNDSNDKQLKNKKKFTCEICAKDGSTRIYNSVEKHKHHMATAHEIYSEEIKRFECIDCPETVWFPTKSKLTYHLGTKHPGVMRFVCEVCTETFILKANYKCHMKTHNLVVQKKYSCDVCNGTFVNKGGYEAHKKRFPGPHIKQSCSHCGFSFSREKHMKNHRCKTLLLEAAAKANKTQQTQSSDSENSTKPPIETEVKAVGNTQILTEKRTETPAETDSSSKRIAGDADLQANKRVVFHRIVPRRNQDQTVYRPVQMHTQNVSEPVVVQELREIDLESGTLIASAATTAASSSSNEPEPQFIVRDLNGHVLQGSQILQLDINDVQQGEDQVYLADWNIVAPYVIRGKSP